jgi:hypothetical protein
VNRSNATAGRSKASNKTRATRTAPSTVKRVAKVAIPRKQKVSEHHCASCAADLRKGDRALFVEEEVGRVFCSEECISTYFTPEIEGLERDLDRHRQRARDLTNEERESFSHLRWVTLEQPDEIYRQKLPSGDFKYTLISEFQPGDRRVWCVCQCLFLRGEPSFLFLAVPTQDAALVAHYRVGERVTLSRPDSAAAGKDAREKTEKPLAAESEGDEAGAGEELPQLSGSDGLADSWTDEETIRARMRKIRSNRDIPENRFEEYEASVGQTLESPDEVWSSALVSLAPVEETVETEEREEGEQDGSGQNPRLYHFIKAYSEEKPDYWYVVIARDTQEEGQIEILDSFPTNDSKVVESLRVGTLEYGENELPAYSRLVH